MRNAKKALLLALCALLLVGASIMGTLAYLTDTENVTNTFTVGNVAITLQDADLASYKLIPGSVYTLNPKVTVEEGSEDCYLYIRLDNQIEGAEAGTIADQLSQNGWQKLDGETNVYYFDGKGTAKQSYPIFATFTVEPTISNSALAAFANKKLNITAYAIQAENTGTVVEAWAKLNAQLAQNAQG